MTAYTIPEELERALDRWIEQLPEPRLSRAEALVMALQDFLMGQGVIPFDEEADDGADSSPD